MLELPNDLPIVERHVIRLIVLDTDGPLLLETQDSTDSSAGVVWQLPGGGIEPGENWAEAAARELREETGLTVDPARLSEPHWQRTATYRYRGVRRLQHERVATVRLPHPQPIVAGRDRDDDEQLDCIGYRWWPAAEIVTSSESFYPGRLPSLLPKVLGGEHHRAVRALVVNTNVGIGYDMLA